MSIDNIKKSLLPTIFVTAILLGVFMHVSCAGVSRNDNFTGDTLALRHSLLLQIIECDGYTVVDVKSPWKNALLHRYLLVPKHLPLPSDTHGGTVIRTPLDTLLVFSTVHAELISNLGCATAVAGVCDAQYITTPELRDRLSDGTIVDCGSSLNVNLERLVQLAPQAVWVLPFENGGYGKLEMQNFPIVECADYMESSPLGCAEWMRLYGRILGCAAKADSLFDTVEREYMSVRAAVEGCTARPTLLCELKNSSAWYVPAGNSTMGRLYSDAGADYLFADYAGSGSVPLAFETVLDKAADASFWLIKYGSEHDRTYSSLASEFEGYGRFAAYKNRKIYGCNLTRKRFYEETPFRPDILLKELAAIFHPELFTDYTLRYYEKLQE